MKIQDVRVQNYRCIDDSGWISLDELTCFIGRNESGKTSILEALTRLNPPTGQDGYDPYTDYPRRDWREYDGEDDSPVVVEARFELTTDERAAVKDAFDYALLAGSEVTVSRDYAGQRRWSIDLDESEAIEYLRETHSFGDAVDEALGEARSFADLAENDQNAHATVVEEFGESPAEALSQEVGTEVLADFLPEFQYIGEEACLDGTVDVAALLERRGEEALEPGDRAFLSLLTVAGLDPEELEADDDWRELTAELEAASAAVSQEAMSYWSQSGDIGIRIEHRSVDDRDLLDLRVENRDHGVTVEFDQRSQGFRRFFSTFCRLAALREADRDLVVMIDEPGTSLHARAKQEFLAFLKAELAGRYRLLYTTHSPFMIDPADVHRTKMVMADPPGEHNVVTDAGRADDHTKFPLKAVFEFDLMDAVLVTPTTLVVERRADHVYLSVLSNVLEQDGREGLDGSWTVVPITDHRNIERFTELFGEARLDIAALLTEDPRSAGSDEDALADVELTLVREYLDGDGTIEDLFSEEFYLTLVSETYASTLAETTGVPDRIGPGEIEGRSPIVDRLSEYFADNDLGSFDPERPARYLLANREELVADLDKESTRAFGRVCRGLNRTLESFESVDTSDTSFFGLFGT